MEQLGNAGRTVVFVSHALSSIAQLCDRAIWIDGGHVVGDGEPAEVIATYLHQTHSAGADRVWDEESAPGNDLAKILSIRALPHEGMPPGVVDVRQAIGIEIGFKVLREGKPLFPKIKVLDEEGAVAFNAMDTDERWLQQTPPGEYVSTAWIPGNLLNEGYTSVEVAVCSVAGGTLHPHASRFDAVAFHVQDPGDGGSARGPFVGQLRGVVRPLLDWTTEEL